MSRYQSSGSKLSKVEFESGWLTSLITLDFWSPHFCVINRTARVCLWVVSIACIGRQAYGPFLFLGYSFTICTSIVGPICRLHTFAPTKTNPLFLYSSFFAVLILFPAKFEKLTTFISFLHVFWQITFFLPLAKIIILYLKIIFPM